MGNNGGNSAIISIFRVPDMGKAQVHVSYIFRWKRECFTPNSN